MVGNSVNYSQATAHIFREINVMNIAMICFNKIHLNIVCTSTSMCLKVSSLQSLRSEFCIHFLSLPTHAKVAFISVKVNIISTVQIMKLLIF